MRFNEDNFQKYIFVKVFPKLKTSLLQYISISCFLFVMKSLPSSHKQQAPDENNFLKLSWKVNQWKSHKVQILLTKSSNDEDERSPASSWLISCLSGCTGKVRGEF